MDHTDQGQKNIMISQEDFDGLNDRVRHYMDWSVNTLYFLALREVGNLSI